jgi:hypothetical protein
LAQTFSYVCNGVCSGEERVPLFPPLSKYYLPLSLPEQRRGRRPLFVSIYINLWYVPTAIIITEDARSRKTAEESLINKTTKYFYSSLLIK